MLQKIMVYIMIDTPWMDNNTLKKEFLISEEDWENDEGKPFFRNAMKKILEENNYDIDDISHKYYWSWHLIRNIPGE